MKKQVNVLLEMAQDEAIARRKLLELGRIEVSRPSDSTPPKIERMLEKAEKADPEAK